MRRPRCQVADAAHVRLVDQYPVRAGLDGGRDPSPAPSQSPTSLSAFTQTVRVIVGTSRRAGLKTAKGSGVAGDDAEDDKALITEITSFDVHHRMTPLPQRLSKAGSRYAAARESLRERATPYFGIDPRALGAFRNRVGTLPSRGSAVLPASGGERSTRTTASFRARRSLEISPLLGRLDPRYIRFGVGANGTARGRGLCRRRPARRLSNASVDGRLPVLLASLYARNPYVINGGTRFWPCSSF